MTAPIQRIIILCQHAFSALVRSLLHALVRNEKKYRYCWRDCQLVAYRRRWLLDWQDPVPVQFHSCWLKHFTPGCNTTECQTSSKRVRCHRRRNRDRGLQSEIRAHGADTQLANRTHGRVGHVFQGRFKAILIGLAPLKFQTLLAPAGPYLWTSSIAAVVLSACSASWLEASARVASG